jgi:pyruvate dehydrogenase E2 component (dihydrolipoamide acetyltransferase)
MSTQVLMPALSPTMSEGKLSKWLIKEGDVVRAGDLIAEIETDKAIMEFESSEDGTILKLLIKEGAENIKVNEPIAVLDTSNLQSVSKDIDKNDNKKNNIVEKKIKNNENLLIKKEDSSENSKKKIDSENRIKISPLAKRIALQNNINFNEIKGSGPLGRIIKVDIVNLINKNDKINSTTVLKPLKTEEEFIPLTPMRKTIANQLSKSKREIPHFYLRKNIYVDKLLSARKLLNKKLEQKKIKISINDIIIKAIAHALYNNPDCNVTWGEDKIIKSKSTDVALAIAIDEGLITPVIKDIKNKNLSDLSLETKSLIERSKNRRLKADELNGGTITISNLGMMEIDNFDAIINPPHGSILAVGKTQEVVCFDENEKVIKKTIIQLTLSVDHRMIDGAVGAKFLNEIASFLEEPVNFLA